MYAGKVHIVRVIVVDPLASFDHNWIAIVINFYGYARWQRISEKSLLQAVAIYTRV
jgi:hypothetical protein